MGGTLISHATQRFHPSIVFRSASLGKYKNFRHYIFSGGHLSWVLPVRKETYVTRASERLVPTNSKAFDDVLRASIPCVVKAHVGRKLWPPAVTRMGVTKAKIESPGPLTSPFNCAYGFRMNTSLRDHVRMRRPWIDAENSVAFPFNSRRQCDRHVTGNCSNFCFPPSRFVVTNAESADGLGAPSMRPTVIDPLGGIPPSSMTSMNDKERLCRAG